MTTTQDIELTFITLSTGSQLVKTSQSIHGNEFLHPVIVANKICNQE